MGCKMKCAGIFLGVLVITLATITFVASIVTGGFGSHGADNGINYVIVDLRKGQQLRGVSRRLVTGQVIDVFQGVPFAAHPIDSLRWSEPVPLPPWVGRKDALKPGNVCPQRETPKPSEPESEDCLYLNIFAPSTRDATITSTSSSGSVNNNNDDDDNDSSDNNKGKVTKQLLPVLVNIHGGSFKSGTGSFQDLTSMASRGVIAVSINYRLGPLGFLSTGDDVMPGNYGMLDQVQALRWVRDNIKYFGGDPEKVTLMGDSAGSVCVSLHIMSPLSKGLFQRAILNSGFSLGLWGVERPEMSFDAKAFTSILAKSVNCSLPLFEQTSPSILKCLRKIDAKKLISETERIRKKFDIDIMLSPRVESTFGFLPEFPSRLLATRNFNDVDTIRGFTTGEWSSVITDPFDNGISPDEFSTFFSRIFETYALKNKTQVELTNIVREAYLSEDQNSLQVRASLVDALTDTLFAVPGLDELEKMIKFANSYRNHFLYQFGYHGRSEFFQKWSRKPEWMGTPHGAQRKFIFTDMNPDSKFQRLASEEDKEMADFIQTAFTNFMKTGDPTRSSSDSEFESVGEGPNIKWPPYAPGISTMLEIGHNTEINRFSRHDKVKLYEKTILPLLF